MQARSFKFKSLLIPMFAFGFSVWSNQGAIYNEVGGRVVVEGEHFDSRADGDDGHKYLVAPDELSADEQSAQIGQYQNARSGKYLVNVPQSGQNRNNEDLRAAGPRADFKVQINTPGDYTLYVRDTGFDGGSDSCYFSIVELSSPGWYRYAPAPANGDFASERRSSGVPGWDNQLKPEINDAGGGEEATKWTISKAGVYTIRWQQREPGNALDALILQLITLPAPTDPGPAESPIVGAKPEPLKIATRVPAADAKAAAFNSLIQVTFLDGTTTLDQASVALKLDSTAIAKFDKTSKSGATTASFQPTQFFAPLSQHTVSVDYKDNTGKAFSDTWSFTVQNYIILSASWAVQPDSTKKGFLVRTWQSDTGQPNTLAWTEEQLRGLHGDNVIVDPTKFTDKQFGNSYYDETGTINYWNTGGQGNFSNNDASGTGAQNTPGLANDGTNDNNYSLEIITAIELPAGVVKMGVNSDDGFRVSALGSGDPRDAFATILGQFDGGRGVANTEFSFVVEKGGVYPFRMIYEEGGGDSAVEWYSVAADGTRHLINDASDAKALKSYRSAPQGIYVESVSPGIGSGGQAVSAPISATIVDGAKKVVPSSVKLTVDGAAIAASATKTGDKTTITYKATAPFPEGSRHTVGLTYADDSTPPNSRTVTWKFDTEITVKTFVAGTLFIEAEDVDFGHGKYVKDKKIGMNGQYPGGAYNALGTADDKGFDYNTNDNAGQAYRPDTGIAAGKENGSAGNERGLFQVQNYWTLGWNDSGEWYNYTREFPSPAKDYEVYGHLSSGGAPINIRVDQIVSGQGQADAQQVKKTLGYFKPGRATAGWDTLEIFRLSDIDGNPITVNLGGVTTLRTTILGGSNSDQDYFAFVPALAPPPPTEKPKISGIKSDGKNVTIEWTGAATLQAADEVTGPWADVAGAASGKAIALSGNRKFYRLKQ